VGFTACPLPLFPLFPLLPKPDGRIDDCGFHRRSAAISSTRTVCVRWRPCPAVPHPTTTAAAATTSFESGQASARVSRREGTKQTEPSKRDRGRSGFADVIAFLPCEWPDNNSNNSNRQQQQATATATATKLLFAQPTGAGCRSAIRTAFFSPPPSPLPCPPTLLQNLIHVQAYGCPWRHRCSRSVDGLAWLGWLGWLHPPPPSTRAQSTSVVRPSVVRRPSVKSAGSAFARSHPRPQLSAGPVERRTPPPMNEEHVHTYICTYPKSCCMVVVVFFLFLPASSLLPTHQTPARSYLLSFFLSSFLPSFLLSVASVASRLVSPIETTDMYGYPAHRTSERANRSDE